MSSVRITVAYISWLFFVVIIKKSVGYFLFCFAKIQMFAVITKKNALVCQFASPLDVDTHNKPEVIFFLLYIFKF